MEKILKLIGQLLSLGLLFEAHRVQAQLTGTYRSVATTKNLGPFWILTANPDFSLTLGTLVWYSDFDDSNESFYFKSFIFNSSATIEPIAPYVQTQTDPECSLLPDEIKIVLPKETDAFYFYILRGINCTDDGILKVTHLDLSSGIKPTEIVTMNAPGFSNSVPWNFTIGTSFGIPGRNYFSRGRNEIITTHLLENQGFTVARSRIELAGQFNQLVSLNVTGVQYNPKLQINSTLGQQSYIDLHEYNDSQREVVSFSTATHVLTAAISRNLSQLTVAAYQRGKLVQSPIVLHSENATSIFFEATFYPYNQSAMILLCNMLRYYSSGYFYVAYLLEFTGNIQRMHSWESRNLQDILALQKNHDDFKRGGILILDTGGSLPELKYLSNNESATYSFPRKNYWSIFGLAESADTLHLEELVNRAGINQLGSWLFSGPNQSLISTTGLTTPMHPDPTTQRINTSNTSNSFMTTSQSRFFDSHHTAYATSANNQSLLFVLGAYLTITLASAIGYCLLMLYQRKIQHQARADDTVNLITTASPRMRP